MFTIKLSQEQMHALAQVLHFAITKAGLENQDVGKNSYALADLFQKVKPDKKPKEAKV